MAIGTRQGLQCLAVIGVCAIMLSGCVTPNPPTSTSQLPIVEINIALSQSDESLPLIENYKANEFQKNDAIEQAVRWGGTIAGIENLAENTTVIEVVSRPLGRNGRPIHNDKSDGRFVARLDQFLDPQIIKVGRDITVVGSVTARKSGQIGQTDYVFPLLDVENYTFWKKQTPQRHFAHWNTFRGRPDPLWPFWIHRKPSHRR